MRKSVKVILSIFSFFAVLVMPFVLNIAGFISVGLALAGFMIIFGGSLMFGTIYAGYFMIMDSTSGSGGGTNLSFSDTDTSFGKMLHDINDELKGMEGHDQIDTMYGEEVRYKQRVFYDENQNSIPFIGISAFKKKKKKKVVVIYSPVKKASNGTYVWDYIDDPNWVKRQNPLDDFEPFKNSGRGMYRREEDRRGGRGSGDISISLDSNNSEDYEEFG